MNVARIAMIVTTLMAPSAVQPTAVCGGCHVRVTPEITTNTIVDDSSEYQVVSRASDLASFAREISSIAARLTAPANENRTPTTARSPGWAPIIRVSPRKATIAAVTP